MRASGSRGEGGKAAGSSDLMSVWDLKGALSLLDILWMDEILHHFETMGNQFVGIHRRIIVQDFVHPQYVHVFFPGDLPKKGGLPKAWLWESGLCIHIL